MSKINLAKQVSLETYLHDEFGLEFSFKPNGWSNSVKCPLTHLHEDAGSSFGFNRDKGYYKCHGHHEYDHGDIVNFVAAQHGVSLGRAAHIIIEKYKLAEGATNVRPLVRKARKPSRSAADACDDIDIDEIIAQVRAEKEKAIG